VHLVCVVVRVLRIMELECLSYHARCSGDLGDGWAEEVLSLRSKISESLAHECEVMDVVRPHAEWP
jgi:hypothetical protein